jgi:hypothetical protein
MGDLYFYLESLIDYIFIRTDRMHAKWLRVKCMIKIQLSGPTAHTSFAMLKDLNHVFDVTDIKISFRNFDQFISRSYINFKLAIFLF